MRNEQPLLRTQLLGWLLAPLVLLLTADTFVSYWVALSFSQRAHDRTLLEVAREFSLYLRAADGGLALQMPEEARRLLFTDPEDRLHFEAAALDGRAFAGERIPAAPAGIRRGAEAFYDGEVQGEAVRVIELRLPAEAASGRPAAVVRVAETKHKRNALAREILASVILPQLLLIAIAGAVVWLGVVRGLRPLARLQRAVAARSQPAVDRGRAGRGRAAAGGDQRPASAPGPGAHPAGPLHRRRRTPAEDADRRAARAIRSRVARAGRGAHARGAAPARARPGPARAPGVAAALARAQRA